MYMQVFGAALFCIIFSAIIMLPPLYVLIKFTETKKETALLISVLISFSVISMVFVIHYVNNIHHSHGIDNYLLLQKLLANILGNLLSSLVLYFSFESYIPQKK